MDRAKLTMDVDKAVLPYMSSMQSMFNDVKAGLLDGKTEGYMYVDGTIRGTWKLED